ncbi:c-type cytochrome [Pantoea sp. 18069]|uniref:c-type cytochrome n=1 Tax=Pantoea sp. 18069 TaxID=2681415 RepID=UPI001359998E|nr:c-type cytochrome [Pantoea sp. 18069]
MPLSTSLRTRVYPPPALLLCALAGLAQAQQAYTPAAPALSPSSVAVLAGACVSCHGPHGYSTTAIPSIAGQSERRLHERLQAFKDGSARDATIMTRLMRGYDDQQIQALAQWFAQVP